MICKRIGALTFVCLALFGSRVAAAPQVTVAVRSVPSGVLYVYRVFNSGTQALTSLEIGEVPGSDPVLTAAPIGLAAPDLWSMLVDQIEERALWRVQWISTKSPIAAGKTQCGFAVLSDTPLDTFATAPFTVGFVDGTEVSGTVRRDDSMPICGTTALLMQHPSMAESVAGLVSLTVSTVAPAIVRSLQLFVDGSPASVVLSGSQGTFQWNTTTATDRDHSARIQYVSSDGVVHDGPSLTIFVNNQQ